MGFIPETTTTHKSLSSKLPTYRRYYKNILQEMLPKSRHKYTQTTRYKKLTKELKRLHSSQFTVLIKYTCYIMFSFKRIYYTKKNEKLTQKKNRKNPQNM